MITIGVPLKITAKSSHASSSEEQKQARGDLWKRPQLLRSKTEHGEMFKPIFKEECHKLGFDPDDAHWRPGPQ